MAITGRDHEVEVQIIAQAIARTAAALDPQRRSGLIGRAVAAASARRFGTEAPPKKLEVLDFVDALTMAVFDEIEKVERGSGL